MGANIAGAMQTLEDLIITMPAMLTVMTDETGDVVSQNIQDEHKFKREFDQQFTQETKYYKTCKNLSL